METPPENVCPVASGMEQLLNVWRQTVCNLLTISETLINNMIITGCPLDEQSASIAIVASSLAFLTIGVVLGALAVYLVLRVKARPQKSMSAASPPLPSPPVQYEDINLVGEDNNNIHLTTNKAYGPIVPKQKITTSLNAAYVEVAQL